MGRAFSGNGILERAMTPTQINSPRIESPLAIMGSPSIMTPMSDDPRDSKRFSLNSRNRSKKEREVLVGTPVKEGHVNYWLMYDMLTGIRISVSRYNAKQPRAELDPQDFQAAHKLAFDT